MPSDPVTEPAPCPSSARPIDRLGEMPEEVGRRHGTLAVRLDRLDDDARAHDAPGAALAAIGGVEVIRAPSAVPPPAIEAVR